MSNVDIYCVYLTTYSGNLLPPFYIGYTFVSRVHSGYHGSVSSLMYSNTWASEIKNNPHLFKTRILSVFPTRKQAMQRESKLHKLLKVGKNPLYINRVGTTSNYKKPAKIDKHTKRDKLTSTKRIRKFQEELLQFCGPEVYR